MAFSPTAMEDELGIVYLIENAQQFWSEVEDILCLPSDNSTTLSQLDSALKRFLSICATYHEQYLQSPLQLEHACAFLLDSELFAFHSERMCEILSDDAQSNTNPHVQFIIYNIVLYHGRRHPSFFRSHKRWQPLIPLLLDHILVGIDPEVEDTYMGSHSVDTNSSVPIPIEAKMRSLAVRLVYEVCRVQKMNMQDLKIFDDSFLDYFFDLVEQTRNMQDETFNYSVIKLIVSLNEQFMVASLNNAPVTPLPNQTVYSKSAESKNRVLNVLMRRLGMSKTFGENMIFMLNRADRTPEDLCMQLLVLKLLYLLFTTHGTSEYFYTNDLRVLVDVFLRELVDLDEESESLRHTYLRVLHPLLTKTQLREVPYKRTQIVRALESLTQNEEIRDVNPTTKRLVERCLSGDWCVQLRKANVNTEDGRGHSPSNDSVAAQSLLAPPPHVEKSASGRQHNLKPRRSTSNLQETIPQRPSWTLETIRRPSTESSGSLPGIAAATAPAISQKKRTHKPVSIDAIESSSSASYLELHRAHPQPIRADSIGTAIGVGAYGGNTPPSASSLPSSPVPGQKPRRSAPAPPKRRKPPAVPVGRTNGGATITAIASSSAA